MRKIKSLSIIFILLGIIIFPNLIKANDNQVDLADTQQQTLNKLEKNSSNLYIDWDDLDAIPDWVRMTNLNIEWESDDYEDRVYQFLKEYKDIYKIKKPKKELRVIEEKTDDLGMTHITLQQYFKETVPIYAGRLKFHFRKDGTISSINGTYLPNIPQDLNPTPTITEEEAINIAKNNLKEEFNLNDEKIDSLEFEAKDKELIVYNHELISKETDKEKLVWHFSLFSKKSLLSSKTFFINAHTGEIIRDNDFFSAGSDRETYVLNDCDESLTVYGGGEAGTLTYDEDSADQADTVDSTDEDEDAWKLHNYAKDSYDYYDSVLGSSYSGLEKIMSYSHLQFYNSSGDCESHYNSYGSAGYDGTIILFGDGLYVVDLVGHEFTHSFIDYTANLDSENEPGALNESYTDVFGEFIEADSEGLTDAEIDWLMAADADEGAIRSLSHPADSPYNDPDNTSDACSLTNDYCGYSDDNGGTHTNNGIPNNADYLLTMGGTNDTSLETVTGIGRAAVEKFYYRTLTTYLDTSSDFEDAYQEIMTSCLDLYESDSATYPIEYCESVFDAFHAVGINEDDSFLRIESIPLSPTEGEAPLEVCFAGNDVTAVNSTVTTYEWDFEMITDSDGDGDNTNDVDDTGSYVCHTYNDDGYHYARLTITDDVGNSTTASSETITVTNPIDPSFTVSGDGAIAPAIVSFDASATTDATGTIIDYSWDYGDGDSESTGTTAITSHEYTIAGTYEVTLTVTDDNGYTNIYTESIELEAVGSTEVSGTIYDETWTADASPYVITSSISVASGYTLTIEPGVVVKFKSSSGYLTVNGTLDAQGTSTDPIVFTSYYDDDYGGDTNGDGAATTPDIEDWRYIKFNSGSTATIDNTVIRYGGYDSSHSSGTDYDMLSIYSDDVTVSNSTISDCEENLIYIENASPTLTGNIIDDAESGHSAIYISGGSPIIDSNTITSSTYGVYVTDGGMPTISSNDIYSNSSYGVYNADSSVTVNAENNFWGDSSGPYNGTSNPTGTGDNVNDYVDFDPWITYSVSGASITWHTSRRYYRFNSYRRGW